MTLDNMWNIAQLEESTNIHSTNTYMYRFIQDIGAKNQIMELMTHQDPDVRYQALIAVQKFMTNSWNMWSIVLLLVEYNLFTCHIDLFNKLL
jgi:hypothetical protein